MGGTYRSARLPIRGPSATRRFRQKSTVDGRLKKKSTSQSTVDGQLRKEKGRRRGKEKKRRGEERIPHPRVVLARLPSLPAGHPRPLSLLREETDQGDLCRFNSTRRRGFRWILGTGFLPSGDALHGTSSDRSARLESAANDIASATRTKKTESPTLQRTTPPESPVLEPTSKDGDLSGKY
ncbi:hypothetical protein GW17_00006723 [Ensete ventricosum]|nr:hypothetical protein GW17_00006723 [Ensete ventricosum]